MKTSIQSSFSSGCHRHCLSMLLGVAIALTPVSAVAQAKGIPGYTDPLAPGYLHRASLMLSSGNPLGTSQQLTAITESYDALDTSQKIEQLALKGAALFEMGDFGCVAVLEKLIKEYPASSQATQALLTVGDWYWLHAEWHKALDMYGKTDISRLADGQRRLYSYRKALAYLKCGISEKAAPLFASIATDPEYSLPAKYYTAYIRYLAKDYDAAYGMMKDVAQHSSAEGIEPLYYMAQMEYLRGQYDDVLTHASALISRKPVAELLPEIHRIAGLSHFRKGDYDAARPHLEKFMASVEAPNDDAVYALGAILYADNEYTDAEKYLRTLTNRGNDLAQGSYLYLGQIAEQRGDMNAAAMAFSKAAEMAYDQRVAETALYNHMVALTKGGNTPFSSTITMLEDFLSRYPHSRYAGDVQESLASAYFYEHDYARALAAIDKVSHPSKTTLATKQKILYKLGMSELTSGNAASAATHFRAASEMTASDASLADESCLWLAEALYHEGDYRGAADAYSRALKGSLSADNRIVARYGLAYAQFKHENWREAQKNFADVAENRKTSVSMKGDALEREADCFLYLGDYTRSAARYQRAAREGSGDPDYAAFRYAVVEGLIEGTDSKMKKLNAFLSERGDSKWTPEVLLEAGNTMAALDMPDKAAPYFERLAREYPKDHKSRSGALSLALSFMKQGAVAKARSAFMDIIRTWPTSEEASLANEEMRRICASDGTLAEYARFLSGISGAPQIDPDEMDAITFEGAETAYADNRATGLLEQYIALYPDGRYLSNALMDLAEAADNDGDASKALIYLDRLLSVRGDSPQVPAALFLKADLLEAAGNSEKALEAYLTLEQRGGQDFAPEATAGVMRTTSDPRQRTEYARRLLLMGGVSTEDAEEARFQEASGMLHGADRKAGEAALRKLAAQPNSLSGAKSAVELGEWYITNGDIKNALTVLETFTDAGSVHAYWLARGYISLADAYHHDGNDYLAVEYLKSLRDNYPGGEEDITEAIRSKIKEYSRQ